MAAAAALLLALTAGCASVPADQRNPVDPWEGFNRGVYAFNDRVDEALLKPVATAYRDVLPELVRRGIGNVLGNIDDAWSGANQLLQGKVHAGLDMGMRVLVNTFFGLAGLLDPATEMGLTKRSEDFGQTLGVWGVGPGPYVVLPLLGPSSVRDTGGFVVDRQFSASKLPETDAGQYGVLVLEIVHARAGLLGTTQLLDAVALDRYSFTRDAYLARRRDQVHDGAPPPTDFYDEFADDDAAAAAKKAAPPAGPASTPLR